MEYLNSYARKVGFIDPNMRGRRVSLARAKEIKTFMQDPSAFTAQAIEPDQTVLIPKRVRMINESVLKQLNPERVYSKYFIPHPDEEMISGTMLFGIDMRDYLITAVTTVGEVHQQAVSQKMNVNVEYMLNGIKIIHPAVGLAVSKMADAVEGMKLITIPDSMIRVRIQSNSKTRAVKRNQRMKVAGQMYLLTRVDTFTDEGVINWSLTEELNVDDDVEEIPTSFDPFIDGAAKIHKGQDYIYYLLSGEAESWSLADDDGFVVIKEQSSIRVVLRVEKTVLKTFRLQANLTDATQVEREIRIISLL